MENNWVEYRDPHRKAASEGFVELVGTDPVCDAENLQWIGDVF